MLAVLAICCIAAGQDTKDQQDPYAHSRHTAQSIKASIMGTEGRVALQVSANPLLSFKDTVGGWHQGTAWVWGQEGRPAALLCLSTLQGNQSRMYEFLCFTNNDLRFELPEGVQWRPTANWRTAAIPKARTPAGSRRLRLSQIKSIARRFTAYERDFYADREKGVRLEMRLLTQPIYRYPKESTESLDGAFFAFTRDGNLELLLIVEAEKQPPPKAANWVYSARPVTVHELHLLYDGEEIWSERSLNAA